MAIEKGLYQAPQGIESLAEQEPELEIEIEDPEEVTIGVDGLEISLEPEVETSDHLPQTSGRCWPSRQRKA